VSCISRRWRSRRPASDPCRHHGTRRRRQPRNPGPSGAGAVVEFGDGRAPRELCSYLGEATNNVAEYRALLLALEEAARHAVSSITVHSDSELLVRQLRGEYKVKAEHLRPLHAEACRRLRVFPASVYCMYRARKPEGGFPGEPRDRSAPERRRVCPGIRRPDRTIYSWTGPESSEEARWPPVPAPHRRGGRKVRAPQAGCRVTPGGGDPRTVPQKRHRLRHGGR